MIARIEELERELAMVEDQVNILAAENVALVLENAALRGRNSNLLKALKLAEESERQLSVRLTHDTKGSN